VDGEYREVKNDAVSDLLEPGSVFKTASIMVALDDGVVDTTYSRGNGRRRVADVRHAR
jgi:cell division protein FtsI (penicillin-binding protein 3)